MPTRMPTGPGDPIYFEADMLDETALERLSAGHCPDCNYRGFVLGPRGGSAMNIECGNLECRARFNITPGLINRIVWAQRIPKAGHGGSSWT
jgi:hypothetical protein